MFQSQFTPEIEYLFQQKSVTFAAKNYFFLKSCSICDKKEDGLENLLIICNNILDQFYYPVEHLVSLKCIDVI